MSDEHLNPVVGAVTDDLTTRLGAIEGQPLSERAAGYVQLHDEMRDRLEGGDAPPMPRAD